MSAVDRHERVVRCLAWGVLACFCAWVAEGLSVPVELVGEARMALPPEHPEAIFERRAVRVRPARAIAMMALVAEVSRAKDVLGKLSLVCGRLAALPVVRPGFTSQGGRVLRHRPLGAARMLARWRAGEQVDALSTAWLAVQLLTSSGVAARLAIGDDGKSAGARAFAGVEVWFPEQRGWAVFDPVVGLLFSKPEGFQSLQQLRAAARAGGRIDVTPLVAPLPTSPLGDRWLEYRDRVRNGWYPAGVERWPSGAGPAVWFLGEAGGDVGFCWRAASGVAKLSRRLSAAMPWAGLRATTVTLWVVALVFVVCRARRDGLRRALTRPPA
ncbi:MAG: hypothetical protein HYY25_01620 [Candidatus Wallbacteria bacterium]|nr:hypothetical protein [Candidatus Wallbacteria bacterium]